MARSHSLLVFLIIYIHTHSFITFAEFCSTFFIGVRSGRGPPLGCHTGPPYSSPTHYQLCHAAPCWATPHPTEPRRILTEARRTLLSHAAPCWATPHPAEPRRTLFLPVLTGDENEMEEKCPKCGEGKCKVRYRIHSSLSQQYSQKLPPLLRRKVCGEVDVTQVKDIYCRRCNYDVRYLVVYISNL